ncbi:hypothetical protein BX616_002203 [Lobosporangium transversale]|uniref:Uncharacterized protein n=1 Tax=Lobosporangium transversale TaxID=64571 RepID=A0A1Y2GAC8_9FUNG|nr:hypothetical protein BCR41DRAFT_390199 [Lobosporangium transversale]KAF9901625.1 hypothetical protein BX616_002203 [Lobosporangium transversale]ORZ01933.1 hypothetical protein BCR41DRAFT_390199 [Lobosporangium transversale]|eukprot:XP_021876186.1 hypothetical protein BCR41DRAFT_390199 [Lobosporangium transversale]
MSALIYSAMTAPSKKKKEGTATADSQLSSGGKKEKKQQHDDSSTMQFYETHSFITDSSEWNSHEHSMSAYNNNNNNNNNTHLGSFHPGISQQALHSPAYVDLPPRGSSTQYFANRNRTNSNASSLSGGGGYNYNYSGSHMSHVSRTSSNNSTSNYIQSSQQYSQQYQQQQQQQQQSLNAFPRIHSQNSSRQDLATTEAVGSDVQVAGYTSISEPNIYGGYYNPSNTDVYGSSDVTGSHHTDYQYYQQGLAQYEQQQHRSTNSDASFISTSRTFQQEAMTSQTLLQTMDQQMSNPHGSPRATPHSAPKRREPLMHFPHDDDDDESILPPLDQYEVMQQTMTFPTGQGPTSILKKEPRTNNNFGHAEFDREVRADRAAFQTQTQTQTQAQLSCDTKQADSEHLGPSAEERKIRRRSSLPTSLDEVPGELSTSLQRRGSGVQRSPKYATVPTSTQAKTLMGSPLHEEPSSQDSEPFYSWDGHESMLSNGTQSVNAATGSIAFSSAENEQQRLEQQRQNKRNSGRQSLMEFKPPLMTKSQLRLSSSPNPSEADATAIAVAVAQMTESNDGNSRDGIYSIDTDSGAQQQPRNGVNSDLKGPSSLPSRPRATTPLGLVIEETSSIPTGLLIRSSSQQSLALNTPTSASKARSTTPISGIRPPPGPPPMISSSPPMTSSLSTVASPTANQARKGPSTSSGSSRRTKANGLISTTPILPPATPRIRAGSISVNNITMDSSLHQSLPSVPLPSLPPPPISAPLPTIPSSSPLPSPSLSINTPGDSSASPRRRKISGNKDLMLPTPMTSNTPFVLIQNDIHAYPQDSLPTPISSQPVSPDFGNLPTPSSSPSTTSVIWLPSQSSPSLSSVSTSAPSSPSPSQVVKLKKRVSLLERELECLGKELSGQNRDRGELQFRMEQLTVERDSLEKQVIILQAYIRKNKSQQQDLASGNVDDNNDDDMDSELKEALRQILEERDERLKECWARQEQASLNSTPMLRHSSSVGAGAGATTEVGHEDDVSSLRVMKSQLEREVLDAKAEMERLRQQLLKQEENANRDQKIREELQQKLEALQRQSSESNASIHEQLIWDDRYQQQQEGNQENNNNNTNSSDSIDSSIISSLQQELEQNRQALQYEINNLTDRLQQEEAQYRILQDTVQRLTSKISRLEAQHAAEIQKILQDHEEVMEKVVIEHANALTDLSEQYEQQQQQQRQQQQQQQSRTGSVNSNNNELEGEGEEEEDGSAAVRMIREKVLVTRLQEQAKKNDELEAALFAKERALALMEEEQGSWMETRASLERQLKMEQLKQQENVYRVEQVEKENKRLLTILGDLDLAALASMSSDDNNNRNSHDGEMKAIFGRERQKWMDQVLFLQRKMAKMEEEAAQALQKNMELTVALERSTMQV